MAEECTFCGPERTALKPERDTYDVKSKMFLEQYSSDRYLGLEVLIRQYEKKESGLAKEQTIMEQTGHFQKVCSSYRINYCPVCGRKLK